MDKIPIIKNRTNKVKSKVGWRKLKKSRPYHASVSTRKDNNNMNMSLRSVSTNSNNGYNLGTLRVSTNIGKSMVNWEDDDDSGYDY
jgi:hypothetical protein